MLQIDLFLSGQFPIAHTDQMGIDELELLGNVYEERMKQMEQERNKHTGAY